MSPITKFDIDDHDVDTLLFCMKYMKDYPPETFTTVEMLRNNKCIKSASEKLKKHKRKFDNGELSIMYGAMTFVRLLNDSPNNFPEIPDDVKKACSDRSKSIISLMDYFDDNLSGSGFHTYSEIGD
ncbi:hypothetical protein [Eubacterium callanderi]|uniref:Uncharacterized protein n=1 Tax=Eubacterium callanderi TaxID=53442 RepID=E3GEJ6_9FIRM|nr:hypothetical protein [Eubacterium callanderi]OEZ05772.1 hypothetical protein BUME_08690 [[Butyribacterium] methylotrophicum]ADO38112.1 hypothetical protein ELI_3143 [Eubacterium callanderi]MCB6660128.1 hypothetical protein [Eubacterium callanderi]MCB6753079.1 hypothetical protein [Eubacterium callanderi]MCB7104763.1 hypothetical protein [Eubacterium callanderi]